MQAWKRLDRYRLTCTDKVHYNELPILCIHEPKASRFAADGASLHCSEILDLHGGFARRPQLVPRFRRRG